METWLPAAERSLLRPGDVDVWRVDLRQGDEALAEARSLLCSDELARADRYLFPQPRRNLIASHGALRRVLAWYADDDPRSLRFRYEELGRPELEQTPGQPLLRFNLSHSSDWALIAVVLQADVGVDIERRRTLRDMDSLAEECFSRRELADYYAQTLGDRKTRTFFNAWTRKEAFIKAVGKGLAYPLKSFDVAIVPGEKASLLSVQGDERTAACWSLEAFEAAPEYAGAVAVELPRIALRCFNFEAQSFEQRSA